MSGKSAGRRGPGHQPDDHSTACVPPRAGRTQMTAVIGGVTLPARPDTGRRARIPEKLLFSALPPTHTAKSGEDWRTPSALRMMAVFTCGNRQNVCACTARGHRGGTSRARSRA
jgi:hypothetical protein